MAGSLQPLNADVYCQGQGCHLSNQKHSNALAWPSSAPLSRVPPVTHPECHQGGPAQAPGDPEQKRGKLSPPELGGVWVPPGSESPVRLMGRSCGDMQEGMGGCAGVAVGTPIWPMMPRQSSVTGGGVSCSWKFSFWKTLWKAGPLWELLNGR